MPTQFSQINVNLGTLLAITLPLGGAVWAGATWASDLERHIEKNTEQIEQLVEVTAKNEERRVRREELDEHRDAQAVELMEKLNLLLEREVETGDGP